MSTENGPEHDSGYDDVANQERLASLRNYRNALLRVTPHERSADGSPLFDGALIEYDCRQHGKTLLAPTQDVRYPEQTVPHQRPAIDRLSCGRRLPERFRELFDLGQSMGWSLHYRIIHHRKWPLNVAWSIEIWEQREVNEFDRDAFPDVQNLPSVVQRVLDVQTVTWQLATSLVLTYNDWVWLFYGPEIVGDAIPTSDGRFFQPANARVRWGTASYVDITGNPELHFGQPNKVNRRPEDFDDRLYCMPDGSWVCSKREDDIIKWEYCDVGFAYDWVQRNAIPAGNVPEGFRWTDYRRDRVSVSSGDSTASRMDHATDPQDTANTTALAQPSVGAGTACEITSNEPGLRVSISDLASLSGLEEQTIRTRKSKRKKVGDPFPDPVAKLKNGALQFRYEDVREWWSRASFRVPLPVETTAILKLNERE